MAHPVVHDLDSDRRTVYHVSHAGHGMQLGVHFNLFPTGMQALTRLPARAAQERVPGQKSAPKADEQQGGAKASRVAGAAQRKSVTWADAQAVEGYVPRARASAASGAAQRPAPGPAGRAHAHSAVAGDGGPGAGAAGPSAHEASAAGAGAGVTAGTAVEPVAGEGATPRGAEEAGQLQAGCAAGAPRDAPAPAGAGPPAAGSAQGGSAAAGAVDGEAPGEQAGGGDAAVLVFEVQDPAGPLDAGAGELGARFGELKVHALCGTGASLNALLLGVKQALPLATAESMAVRKLHKPAPHQVADAGELGLAQEQLRRLQAARASGGQDAGMAAELALWREHLAARQDTKLGAGLPAPCPCAAGVLYFDSLAIFCMALRAFITANDTGQHSHLQLLS